jgi:hypothetical protein
VSGWYARQAGLRRKCFGNGDDEAHCVSEMIEITFGYGGMTEIRSESDDTGWWSGVVDILFSNVEI